MEKNLDTDIKSNKKQSKLLLIMLFIVVFLIGSIGIIIYLNGSEERRLSKQIELGQNYLEDMNFDQAIIAFEMALEIEPNNTDANIGLADAYTAKGDYDKALDIYDNLCDEGKNIEIEDNLKNFLEIYIEDLLIRKRYDEVRETEKRYRNYVESGFFDKYLNEIALKEGLEKYKNLNEKMNEVFRGGWIAGALHHGGTVHDENGSLDCARLVLTKEQKRDAYQDIVQELEGYIQWINTTQNLQSEIYEEHVPFSNSVGTTSDGYLKLGKAYEYLQRAYFNMEDMEGCLLARTEWAEKTGFYYLIEEHESEEVENLIFDKYGRVIKYTDSANNELVCVYNEDGSLQYCHETVPISGSETTEALVYDESGKVVEGYKNGHIGKRPYQIDYIYEYEGSSAVKITEIQQGNIMSTILCKYDKYGNYVD